MKREELRAARLTLGLNKAQMARQLQTPYPTYRDWEYGVNPIPGICKVAVEGLLQRDEKFMERLKIRQSNKK